MRQRRSERRSGDHTSPAEERYVESTANQPCEEKKKKEKRNRAKRYRSKKQMTEIHAKGRFEGRCKNGARTVQERCKNGAKTCSKNGARTAARTVQERCKKNLTNFRFRCSFHALPTAGTPSGMHKPPAFSTLSLQAPGCIVLRCQTARATTASKIAISH